MIEPLRVEWTTPDEAKRAAATRQVARDTGSGRIVGDLGLEAELRSSRVREWTEVLVRRYPDLVAVTHHFGAMIDVRYVPEQWGVRTFSRGGVDLGSTGSVPMKLCEAKWVALVVTEEGTREIDPRTLRVTGKVYPGDPLCGTVNGPSESINESGERAR